MAKQKVVLKVAMKDPKRCSKALKTAVGLPGVLSVALDKDCLIVVGDGVDSVALTTILRRKMGTADLVSIGSAEEKKEQKPAEPTKEEKPATVAKFNTMTWQPMPASYYIMYPAAPQPYYHYQHAYQTCPVNDCLTM
ncbi:heavy metal-associated isoprenylated plant protein 16-like [Zingiber officinale]|uniref:heavy metal-associated isoprenylated plant protein 16-like n=1 Tax=Zingiber officinale TaxID=94328 RepID=UPI001C4CD0CC|nr:heavy metal-associated isoprenylated plant protein 16-like [Zingiber officinale]